MMYLWGTTIILILFSVAMIIPLYIFSKATELNEIKFSFQNFIAFCVFVNGVYVSLFFLIQGDKSLDKSVKKIIKKYEKDSRG
ncbi:hypothetical protein LCGC14_2900510 [marine sediment metagenome]|uniref:Uncharacterized protein n=1 Tax=marine sediment metagenome TaxID=412755 RepID=A0A0F9A2D4_9ZZZZ